MAYSADALSIIHLIVNMPSYSSTGLTMLTTRMNGTLNILTKIYSVLGIIRNDLN
jgi:hypothetical protein